MTKRPKTLIHAACLALLLMLVPGIALSEDQAEPAVPQPEKTAEEPALQKSGSLITPPGEEKKEPDAAMQKPSGIAPAGAPAEATATPASEEATSYVIKRGDTLWDIANTFLKDPFLWPFIWKANPNITNPDLIYPGNKLAIPSMVPIERALQAPAEEQPVEKQAVTVTKAPVKAEAAKKEADVQEEPVQSQAIGQKQGIAAARATRPKPVQPEAAEETASTGNLLILPEERPVPVIDKYAMLSAGFVNQEEAADRIVGNADDPKDSLSYDDIVYVKIKNPEQVKIGDKFLIYTELDKVNHPKTGRSLGHLIRGLGILQITAKDSPDVLTARVTLSFDSIERNSLLTPYQEPILVYNAPGKKAKDISGFIVEVTDERTISAQLDFVYLDKGSADGVDAGDQFTVYVEHNDSKMPKLNVGEVQVILVKEHTSTALVRKSIQDMAKGDMVEFKK